VSKQRIESLQIFNTLLQGGAVTFGEGSSGGERTACPSGKRGCAAACSVILSTGQCGLVRGFCDGATIFSRAAAMPSGRQML
jgi:hypothetical protein